MLDLELADDSDDDPPPQYGLVWATGVLNSFRERYSGAVNIVQQAFPKLNYEFTLSLLRDKTRQERWEDYKRVVKYVDGIWAYLQIYFKEDHDLILLHIRKVVSKEFVKKLSYWPSTPLTGSVK